MRKKMEKTTEEKYSIVGTNYSRIDGEDKVTGRAKYTADINMPGQLWAKFVRSPHAHARIVSIDVSAALALPGVKAVVTGEDFPGKLGNAEFSKDMADRYPLARGKARLIGDEIACVAAVDEATAKRGCELVKVEYEELPAVFNIEESTAPGAPALHAEGRANVGMVTDMSGGDVDRAFAEADYTDKFHYSTQMMCHCAMEPHAAAAVYENGDVTLWSSTQSASVTRFWMANALGIPEARMRVIKPYVGGGFGGKLDVFPHEACCCKLAMITGRPVKCVLSREEVFYATRTRHRIDFEIETAFDKGGKFLAKRCLHMLDGGAYGGTGMPATSQSLIWANLPYKIPNIDMVARRVYTNNPVAGAMRGYASCQVHFAHDVHMDEVAEALGIDPVELRRINACTPNYTSPSGLRITSCAFTETLDRAEEAIGWKEKRGRLPKDEGIGFAGSGFVSGTGFPILESPVYSSACTIIRVNRQGYATVFTGSNDIGQGSDTVMVLAAAEELGLDMAEVKICQSDTTLSPWDSGTYGSRVTFLAGNAARRAAVDCKRKLIATAARLLEELEDSLAVRGHRIYVESDPAKGISFNDAVFAYQEENEGRELVGVGAFAHDGDKSIYITNKGNFAPSYSFSTGAAAVKVDEETGLVDISDFIFAHDCGRPLNLRAVEGQIEGSVQMGLGYALFEECVMDRGRMKNPGFRDYRFPTALDMPHVKTILCGQPDPDGPFGAKECGEGSTAPVAPAIVNAIAKATGLHFSELPLTPEKLWRACRAKQKPGNAEPTKG